MATGIAIVAVPRQDDPVWQFSSEKVPHMTILFLGQDPDGLQQIIEFTQHAAETTLFQFGLSVDHRGVLGVEDADVLFFKRNWGIKPLFDFRAQLLQNESIKKAFDSTPQFDGWTPHLTMGFPTAPAKEDDREFPGFNWVSFDRIAVWTGEFEGPTVQLKDQWDMDIPLEMRETVDKVLSHHGVKGMKWGVRKDKNGVRRGTPTAHPDAVLAKSSQAKIKKGSTDVLSNDELRNLVTRLNLEKQFDTLKPPTKGSRAKKLIGEVLLNVGKQQASKVINDQASKQVTRLLANAARG